MTEQKIPAELLETARQVAQAVRGAIGDPERIIARALHAERKAERERCAVAVERLSHGKYHHWASIEEETLAAIRGESE